MERFFCEGCSMMDKEKTRVELQHIPEIFKNKGMKKNFQAGEIIFMKNEPAHSIYYIVEGQVRAFLVYPDGKERTLIYAVKNNVMGEEVFASPPVRIVCTNAITDVKTYRMDSASLLQACMSDPASMQELLSLLMSKITVLHSWIFYTQFVRNEEKIACLLYTLTQQDRDKVNLTHEQIASVTGMSRVTATRVMNGLSEKGFIGQEYKHIRVTDREALKHVFENKEFY